VRPGKEREPAEATRRDILTDKADMFSGIKPTKARVRSLVAWRAGGKETEPLKPLDKPIFR